MVSLTENDQVIITNEHFEGELAWVDRQIPSTQLFEVQLLSDHKPGQALDPIRVFESNEMRLATIDEIIAKKKEWEEKHNYSLA